jgi:hypothetical protein
MPLLSSLSHKPSLEEKSMTTQGWVKPGELLGYARLLKEKGLWPPKRATNPPPNPDLRHATAFIVVPAQKVGDQGVRPVQDTSWRYSPSLHLVNIHTNQPEENPRKGATYRIVAWISNLGDAPVLGGFAEFYVADPLWIEDALGFAVGIAEAAKPKWLGVTPFSLGINEAQHVQSQKTWMPTTDFDLTRALVVRAFDPLGDKLTSDWDSWNDRHIARRNLAPNFDGVWSGNEISSATNSAIGIIKIHVEAIAGMVQSTMTFHGVSYPYGDFEANIMFQALHDVPGRPVSLIPVKNVIYRSGILTWNLYSTTAVAEFKLAQLADGHLYMTSRWGPDVSNMVAGTSHATLTRL